MDPKQMAEDYAANSGFRPDQAKLFIHETYPNLSSAHIDRLVRQAWHLRR